MDIFNKVVYFAGALTTVISIAICIILFFACRSKNTDGRRLELDNDTDENPWTLGTWIAGVFVAGMGVGMMYAPSDLVGYIDQG